MEEKTKMKSLKSGDLINSRFKISKKIGNGSFGKIWLVLDTFNQNKELALKMESKQAKVKHLNYEARIYLFLYKNSSIHGQPIPRICHYGEESDYSYMAMECLGSNLETLFQQQKKKFSLKTIYMIGIQLLKRIKYLHSRRILHRDLKTLNIAIGGNKSNSHRIYLIDFGLAMKYIDSSGKHIEREEGKSAVGTMRFASINTQNGIVQSRRDDVESIGYILLYFYLRKLPWQGLKIKNKEELYKRIKEEKEKVDYSEMGMREELANPIFNMIENSQKLQFYQNPDYDVHIETFKNALKTMGEKNDFRFDWVKNDESQ